MIIDKIVLNTNEPGNRNVVWAKPVENGVELYVYNGGWKRAKTIDDSADTIQAVSYDDEAGVLTVKTKGGVSPIVTIAQLKEDMQVATLNEHGKVQSSQLPSYVDDVLEFDSLDVFPEEGESGIIYVDTLTNKTYRWSGSSYIEVSPGIEYDDATTETSGLMSSQDKKLLNKIKTMMNIQTDDEHDASKVAIVHLRQTNMLDEPGMFTGDIGYKTPGSVVQQIITGTHAYVAKEVDGVMELKQLSDYDLDYFADGENASSLLTASTNYNAFVKIPTFWYKGVNNPYGTEDWDLMFTMDEAETDESWTKWDTNKLISLYEMWIQNDDTYRSIKKSATTKSSASAWSNRVVAPYLDFETWNVTTMLTACYFGCYNLANFAQTHEEWECNLNALFKLRGDSGTYTGTIFGSANLEYLFIKDLTVVWGGNTSTTQNMSGVTYMAFCRNINGLVCSIGANDYIRIKIDAYPLSQVSAFPMLIGSKCYFMPKNIICQAKHYPQFMRTSSSIGNSGSILTYNHSYAGSIQMNSLGESISSSTLWVDTFDTRIVDSFTS